MMGTVIAATILIGLSGQGGTVGFDKNIGRIECAYVLFDGDDAQLIRLASWRECSKGALPLPIDVACVEGRDVYQGREAQSGTVILPGHHSVRELITAWNGGPVAGHQDALIGVLSFPPDFTRAVDICSIFLVVVKEMPAHIQIASDGISQIFKDYLISEHDIRYRNLYALNSDINPNPWPQFGVCNSLSMLKRVSRGFGGGLGLLPRPPGVENGEEEADQPQKANRGLNDPKDKVAPLIGVSLLGVALLAASGGLGLYWLTEGNRLGRRQLGGGLLALSLCGFGLLIWWLVR